MTFKFACPHCGQRIAAALEDVGTAGGCPACRRDFVVPAPPDTGPKTIAVPLTVKATAPPVAVVTAPAPEAPTVTKRGAAIVALLLSILPGFNLVALGLAIYAVVRSDRPGRSGERGLAVAAVTVASLLVIPVNLGLPAAFVGFASFKHPSMQMPSFTVGKPASPVPAKPPLPPPPSKPESPPN